MYIYIYPHSPKTILCLPLGVKTKLWITPQTTA